ncbi:MAG: nucleotidyltransferase [Bacteroidetes bacterium]|nr:MAG: nucleotidyltransferase [Bacteroidota bacterium]TAG92322.1 MAG: nucleotidyltransferase [Bacteroidota bacterium]
MKIIIPMAGRGTRLRPHTLTVPKPLIQVAGKPMVHRIVEDIVKVCDTKVDEIAYIIGTDFGSEIEKQLLEIAEKLGAKGIIQYQHEKLGTAHAILCAKETLKGNVVVAFADTLFKADFKLNPQSEGIIWVQNVENPSAFGVVKLNQKGEIEAFVEKPKEFVSNLAIIGIYYFKDGEYLRQELQYLLDNDIKDKVGEFQLTAALENMRAKGIKFVTNTVTEWLDCGNKDATVYTNQRYLSFIQNEKLISDSAKILNSVIIPPVFIGENAQVIDSVIGPFVSIGNSSVVENSIVKNTIIQENSQIKESNIKDSMIGNYANYNGHLQNLNIGDYSQIQG